LDHEATGQKEHWICLRRKQDGKRGKIKGGWESVNADDLAKRQDEAKGEAFFSWKPPTNII